MKKEYKVLKVHYTFRWFPDKENNDFDIHYKELEKVMKKYKGIELVLEIANEHLLPYFPKEKEKLDDFVREHNSFLESK